MASTEPSSAADVGSVEEGRLRAFDWTLMPCVLLWYAGNYCYNICNKLALVATGGTAGYPLLVASLQLLVGVVYALLGWLTPNIRLLPTVTKADLGKLVPLCFCFCGAHFFTVVAVSAGAVSFVQIVKASEPAFAALLGVAFYGRTVSLGQWLCLIPVMGGVGLASVGELTAVSWAQVWPALLAVATANIFNALKGNENKRCMEAPGLSERIGSVGNQYALTLILSWMLSLPVVLWKEGHQLQSFLLLLQVCPVAVKIVMLGTEMYWKKGGP